jgi:hypothetical protein
MDTRLDPPSRRELLWTVAAMVAVLAAAQLLMF